MLCSRCSCGQVHGTSAGGDTDELRLLSTSSTFINLRAYGGNLDFVSTKVRFCETFVCLSQSVFLLPEDFQHIYPAVELYDYSLRRGGQILCDAGEGE